MKRGVLDVRFQRSLGSWSPVSPHLTACQDPVLSLIGSQRSMNAVVDRDRGQRTGSSNAQKNMMQSPRGTQRLKESLAVSLYNEGLMLIVKQMARHPIPGHLS